MIVKCHGYKHLMVTLLGILVVICLWLSACSGSECSSRIDALEAQIQNLQSDNRQLEKELRETLSDPALEAEVRKLESTNRQLQSENQQVEGDNRQLTQDLQDIHSLVNSPSYANTLDGLTQVQSNTSALAAFVYPLPDLPPLPPGLTVGQIDNAIEQAIALRGILEYLPPPPPFAPSFWVELDELKDGFVAMTYWMEDLEPLPDFLAKAQSLEDLRSRIEGYLGDVENTASDASTMLEQIKNAASP